MHVLYVHAVLFLDSDTARENGTTMATKWDLITEDKRARLDATPTRDDMACARCGEKLPTEGAFARHFTVPDSRYLNLGYCTKWECLHCNDTGYRMDVDYQCGDLTCEAGAQACPKHACDSCGAYGPNGK